MTDRIAEIQARVEAEIATHGPLDTCVFMPTEEMKLLLSELTRLRGALDMLKAAKGERDQLMKVVDAAMIYQGSTTATQSIATHGELLRACASYEYILDQQLKPDYQHAPGEVDWGLYAGEVDFQGSYDLVKQLLANAKADALRTDSTAKATKGSEE